MRHTLLLSIVLALLMTGVLALGQAYKVDIETAKQEAASLREQMRDPDSFVVERVIYTVHKNKEEYCFFYRSKNGFGGMNRASTFYQIEHKKNGEIKRDWDDNRYGREFNCGYVRKREDPGADITQEFNRAQ